MSDQELSAADLAQVRRMLADHGFSLGHMSDHTLRGLIDAVVAALAQVTPAPSQARCESQSEVVDGYHRLRCAKASGHDGPHESYDGDTLWKDPHAPSAPTEAPYRVGENRIDVTDPHLRMMAGAIATPRQEQAHEEEAHTAGSMVRPLPEMGDSAGVDPVSPVRQLPRLDEVATPPAGSRERIAEAVAAMIRSKGNAGHSDADMCEAAACEALTIALEDQDIVWVPSQKGEVAMVLVSDILKLQAELSDGETP